MDDRELNNDDESNFYSVIENGGLPLPTSFEAIELDSSSLYYGRINLQDTYAAMDDVMPVEGAVEYWDGARFVINRKDNCETFDSDALRYVDDSSTGPEPIPADLASLVTLGNGKLSPSSKDIDELLRWESELVDDPYSFTFELNAPAFLQYDWDGDGNYQDNPTAEGTFGIYRGRDRQIYWQEVGW